MKSVAISLALGLAAGAATIAVAQDRGAGAQGPFPERGRGGLTQEDRAALMEGRLAGLKAALRLTAEQEKLWPPVEQALRDLARQRAEAWAARRERWASFRESRAAGKPVERNIPEEMRMRSDRMAQAAASLRKLADASAPLYASLDEGQKRRLGAMMHMMGRGGMHGPRRGWRQGMREEMGRGRWRERHGALEERGRDFAGLEGHRGEGPRGWSRHGFEPGGPLDEDHEARDERFDAPRDR